MNEINYKKLTLPSATSGDTNGSLEIDETEDAAPSAKRIRSDKYIVTPNIEDGSNYYDSQRLELPQIQGVVEPRESAIGADHQGKDEIRSTSNDNGVERWNDAAFGLFDSAYQYVPKDEEDQQEDREEAGIDNEEVEKQYDCDITASKDSDMAVQSSNDASTDIPGLLSFNPSDSQPEPAKLHTARSPDRDTTSNSSDVTAMAINTDNEQEDEEEDNDFIEEEEYFSNSSLDRSQADESHVYDDEEEAFDHNLPSLGICGICTGDMYRVTVSFVSLHANNIWRQVYGDPRRSN